MNYKMPDDLLFKKAVEDLSGILTVNTLKINCVDAYRIRDSITRVMIEANKLPDIKQEIIPDDMLDILNAFSDEVTYNKFVVYGPDFFRIILENDIRHKLFE